MTPATQGESVEVLSCVLVNGQNDTRDIEDLKKSGTATFWVGYFFKASSFERQLLLGEDYFVWKSSFFKPLLPLIIFFNCVKGLTWWILKGRTWWIVRGLTWWKDFLITFEETSCGHPFFQMYCFYLFHRAVAVISSFKTTKFIVKASWSHQFF